jgi:hypothetical protein
MTRKLCTLVLAAVWLLTFDAPAFTQCMSCGSQTGTGYTYAGPYQLGSCGMLGLATCAVLDCTDQMQLEPGFCVYCENGVADSFDCYYFSPSLNCDCTNEMVFEC